MKKLTDRISHAIKHVASKKVLLYCITIIIILLPISISIISVAISDTINAPESTVTVTIKDMQGNVIATDSDSSKNMNGETLASIFNALNERKLKTALTPDITSETPPIKVQITTGNSTTDLTCYFQFNGGTSYCIDPGGNIYLINELDSNDFLASEHAEILYSNARVPSLITIDNETVLPISSNWNYKNIQGVFKKASIKATGTPDDIYSITGQISLAFEQVPDVSRASVYDSGGSMIFDGTIDDMSNVILSTDDHVKVRISAQWKKGEDSVFYGSASYEFNVHIENRSEFSISSDTLARDGFIILSATNVSDISNIKFHSAQCKYTPSFISMGDEKVYALITYPSDIAPQSKTFEFSISYRASMETFTLNLMEEKELTVYDAGILRPLNVELSYAQKLQSLVNNVSDLSSDYLYCQFDFLDPYEFGFKKNIDYNDQIFYITEQSPAMTSKGCEFVVSKYGLAVPAFESGIVVKVGRTEFLGNYVVVEHGMGLKTWYCHLSDVDVKENSLVIKGQSIGKTGISVLSKKEGFRMYLTFNDKLLNPNYIIED